MWGRRRVLQERKGQDHRAWGVDVPGRAVEVGEYFISRPLSFGWPRLIRERDELSMKRDGPVQLDKAHANHVVKVEKWCLG